MRDDLIKVGAAHINRVHAPTHEVADNAGFACIPVAQGFANGAARAIGAYQIGRSDFLALTVFNTLNRDPDMVSGVGEFNHAPTKVNGNARQFLRLPAQDLFNIFL